MKWEDDFLRYIKNLDGKKPVIYCGDLNVAHKETRRWVSRSDTIK